MRPAMLWGIVNAAGYLVPSCVRDKRTRAIQTLTGPEKGWQKRWRQFRKWGCVVVRVEAYPQLSEESHD